MTLRPAQTQCSRSGCGFNPRGLNPRSVRTMKASCGCGSHVCNAAPARRGEGDGALPTQIEYLDYSYHTAEGKRTTPEQHHEHSSPGKAKGTSEVRSPRSAVARQRLLRCSSNAALPSTLLRFDRPTLSYSRWLASLRTLLRLLLRASLSAGFGPSLPHPSFDGHRSAGPYVAVGPRRPMSGGPVPRKGRGVSRKPPSPFPLARRSVPLGSAMSPVRAVLALLAALAAPAAAYFVSIDAHAEECFLERVPSGTKMGLIFEVAEGGFLDIDVEVRRDRLTLGPALRGGPALKPGPARRKRCGEARWCGEARAVAGPVGGGPCLAAPGSGAVGSLWSSASLGCRGAGAPAGGEPFCRCWSLSPGLLSVLLRAVLA